jgi:hypothetical protein
MNGLRVWVERLGSVTHAAPPLHLESMADQARAREHKCLDSSQLRSGSPSFAPTHDIATSTRHVANLPSLSSPQFNSWHFVAARYATTFQNVKVQRLKYHNMFVLEFIAHAHKLSFDQYCMVVIQFRPHCTTTYIRRILLKPCPHVIPTPLPAQPPSIRTHRTSTSGPCSLPYTHGSCTACAARRAPTRMGAPVRPARTPILRRPQCTQQRLPARLSASIPATHAPLSVSPRRPYLQTQPTQTAPAPTCACPPDGRSAARLTAVRISHTHDNLERPPVILGDDHGAREPRRARCAAIGLGDAHDVDAAHLLWTTTRARLRGTTHGCRQQSTRTRRSTSATIGGRSSTSGASRRCA